MGTHIQIFPKVIAVKAVNNDTYYKVHLIGNNASLDEWVVEERVIGKYLYIILFFTFYTF